MTLSFARDPRRILPAVLMGALACSLPAATLSVDTLGDPLTPPAANCSLRAAITAINTASVQGGCPAGTAGDTIAFTVTGLIRLSGALPAITQSLTIQGPGADQLTIDAANGSGIFKIATDSLTVTLTDLTLTRGRGPQSGGGALTVGSGAAIVNTIVAVDRIGFTANGAFFGGAIDLDGGATLSVNHSSFENNFTPNFGGAIDAFKGTLSVTNSTFYGNRAESSSGGGAIYISALATVSLVNCTLAGNVSRSQAGSGGGIKNTGGTLSLRNSILAGNNAANDSDIRGAVLSGGYNLVQARGGSSGWSPADLPNGSNPLLGPLALNAPGATKTMAITAASPAYNALAGCAGAPADDQRGIARPQGTDCDIGAYELIPPLPAEVTATGVGALRAYKGGTAGTVVLDFADQPGMSGFNVYEGGLPMAAATPYSHASAPGNVCAAATTLAAGRRTTAAAGIGTAGSHYYLVTAFTTSEGPSGYNSAAVEISPAFSTCAP